MLEAKDAASAGYTLLLCTGAGQPAEQDDIVTELGKGSSPLKHMQSSHIPQLLLVINLDSLRPVEL